MANAFITKVKANQKNVFYGFKIAITLATIGYLYFTFKYQQDLYTEVFELVAGIIVRYQSWELWLCFALMPVNWALEAWKWQFLASKIERISFINAFKGTLAGLGLGFITPHAVGDYAARIYFLNIKNKIEALGALLLARISMFFVTVFYGIIGFYILNHFKVLKASNFLDERIILLIGFSAFGLFAILVYFNGLQYIPQRFKAKTWIRSVWNALKVLTKYSYIEISTCFLISIIRYFVFTSQYLLLLRFLGVDIFNILVVSAIWMVYFVKAVFPTFNFLNDLGVREVSAVYFLGELGISSSTAVMASLCLWLINLFIPTLIGTGFLIFAKYKKL